MVLAPMPLWQRRALRPLLSLKPTHEPLHESQHLLDHQRRQQQQQECLQKTRHQRRVCLCGHFRLARRAVERVCWQWFLVGLEERHRAELVPWCPTYMSERSGTRTGKQRGDRRRKGAKSTHYKSCPYESNLSEFVLRNFVLISKTHFRFLNLEVYPC